MPARELKNENHQSYIITVNCTVVPSIPINGVLLNFTSTSATIGCANDSWLNVTLVCVNQDIWSSDPTNLNCSTTLHTTTTTHSGFYTSPFYGISSK